MTSLGVVDHKRAFVPDEFKVCGKQLYSSWFYFSGPYTILSCQAKEKKPPVILLSTLHEYSEVLDDDKTLPVMIYNYNQTKVDVDLVNQCINNYTVRRITHRWSLIVFFNIIDIAAINVMTIWLYHNPDENISKGHVRRLFLGRLSKCFTKAHNERRVEQPYLSLKTKLALQSLGYKLYREISTTEDPNNDLITKKKSCPSHPGRKVRQRCDTCQNHVCNAHSINRRTIICQPCQKSSSFD